MNQIKYLILLLISGVCFAQETPITISGKIVDDVIKEPIAYASVTAKTNSGTVIKGTVTSDVGDFLLSVNSDENLILEISYMGFTTKKISKFKQVGRNIDLGVVVLKENTEQLDAVVLQGEVSQTVFKLDKRVFNVGKDIGSTGVGALEVLENVPSVNVNIEGEISLRGSQGVQILINGKPSVLTSDGGSALGTITSDMIESIEVITNPSAKYDAEGTSGIINIVLKKDERKGLNGSVSLNGGIPDNHSVGFSINRRSEKFNLFSQIGVGKRSMPRDSEIENIDYSTDSKVTSKGTSEKNEEFFNFTLGTDYLINDYNIITLSGKFAYEKEEEEADAVFELYDNNTLTSSYNRVEETTADNPKFQYDLQYKKDYENEEDRSLLVSATGQFFGKDQASEFNNIYTDGSDTDRQQTYTDFQQAEYIFKLDYTQSFLEKHTIEAGGQYLMDIMTNDYSISDYEDGSFQQDDDLSNVFDFNQNVLAVYGTYSYELDEWGIKTGLRIENTDVETVLQNSGSNNSKDYTNFFPSAHTSYKVSSDMSFQAGYSKRIYRPRLRDLNPFVRIQNTYNLRTGNPDLNPEYTDSYELTNILKLGKLSLNTGIFYRYTTDVVERIITYQGNVATSIPENIGIKKTGGIEFNAKYIPAKWITLTTDVNYNSFIREGSFQGTSFDFSGDQYSAKASSKFKLPLNIDFETTFNYNSKYKTIQQEVVETWFMDMGIRKKILKGKAIVNFSIRDVFETRIYESYTVQDDSYQRDYNKRGRFMTLGLSFGFGKGEAMEFSGQRRH